MNKIEYSDKEPYIISLMDKYDIYYQKNDFNNALTVAKELVERRGSAYDWLLQGICYMSCGNAEEALMSFSEATKLDP